ncbi:hypothetical protein H2248_009951 [Termitomyces sp. 'cryptogamus']|nr:hypothetical protein H2248_009951 [Termitomyces sp. 'cryptogamus']
MVQNDTLSHPALAFVDMKERPEDYPRPPHVKSAPMEHLSNDNTLSLSSASPLSQETQENVVLIHFTQPLIKDTQDYSFSAHVSAPLVTTGPCSSAFRKGLDGPSLPHLVGPISQKTYFKLLLDDSKLENTTLPSYSF